MNKNEKIRFFKDEDGDIWKWDQALKKYDVYIKSRACWDKGIMDETDGRDFGVCNKSWCLEEITEAQVFIEFL